MGGIRRWVQGSFYKLNFSPRSREDTGFPRDSAPPPEGPGFRGSVTGLDVASERLAARLPAATVTRT